MFGLHVRFVAQPGQGDALEAILLEADEALAEREACRLHVVSRSPEEPESVWVTEAWTSREEHQRSLEDERVRALIERARPLIADVADRTELRPVGGKGL